MMTPPTIFRSKSRVRTQRGFTLIEMLVSVAIFSVVMVIVAAAYLNLINLDHQARATDDVANNLSFAIDTMARTIRTGTQYGCNQTVGLNGSPCSTSFSFTDSSGNFDTYILNTSTHQIGECIFSTNQPCNISTATYFTDPHVQVTNLAFYLKGSAKNDQTQPQVVFTVTGSIVIDATHAPVTFTIQSAATQRSIDL
jgi:prepilin-type N-terminal cleavage/methylation domain-containing protein